jgi:hypothetical protein
MQLNVKKPESLPFVEKYTGIGFDYKLCESSIMHMGCVRDLGVLTDTKRP